MPLTTSARARPAYDPRPIDRRIRRGVHVHWSRDLEVGVSYWVLKKADDLYFAGFDWGGDAHFGPKEARYRIDSHNEAGDTREFIGEPLKIVRVTTKRRKVKP